MSLRHRLTTWFGHRELYVATGDGPRVLERGGLRHLRFGTSRDDQSVYDPADPLHLPLPYTRAAIVGLALPRRLGSVLHLGLGGGTLARVIHHVAPQARQHAVEACPEVVEVARRWFALPASVTVTVADARSEVARLSRGYDLIFWDVFTAKSEPVAIPEAAALRALLRTDGWLVVNATRDFATLVADLQRVFASVGWLALPDTEQAVLFASDSPGARDRGLRWAQGSIVS